MHMHVVCMHLGPNCVSSGRSPAEVTWSSTCGPDEAGGRPQERRSDSGRRHRCVIPSALLMTLANRPLVYYILKTGSSSSRLSDPSHLCCCCRGDHMVAGGLGSLGPLHRRLGVWTRNVHRFGAHDHPLHPFLGVQTGKLFPKPLILLQYVCRTTAGKTV